MSTSILSKLAPVAADSFVASGASHAPGFVPDPGSTAGSTKYLREDATWATPTAGTASAGGSDTQVQYNSGGALAGSANLAFDGTGLTLHSATTTQAKLILTNDYLDGGTAGTAGGGADLRGFAAFGNNYLEVTGRSSGSGMAVVYKPLGTPTGIGYVFQFNTDNAGANAGLLIVGDSTSGSRKQIVACDNSGGGTVNYPLVFRNGNNQAWNAAADVYTIATTGVNHTFTTDLNTRVVVAVKGVTSQSGDLQQWQDPTGTPLASVSSAGAFTGPGSGLTTLNASSLSSGTVATARLGSGTASSSTYLRGDGAWAPARNLLATATDGATVTFDLSVTDRYIVTLGGNRTLALSNVTTGMSFTLLLKQDATTGSRTVTWFSGISWSGGTVPTLATAVNKIDAFTFLCTGSGAYIGAVAMPNC